MNIDRIPPRMTRDDAERSIATLAARGLVGAGDVPRRDDDMFTRDITGGAAHFAPASAAVRVRPRQVHVSELDALMDRGGAAVTVSEMVEAAHRGLASLVALPAEHVSIALIDGTVEVRAAAMVAQDGERTLRSDYRVPFASQLKRELRDSVNDLLCVGSAVAAARDLRKQLPKVGADIDKRLAELLELRLHISAERSDGLVDVLVDAYLRDFARPTT